MPYLLDTNMWIYYLKRSSPVLEARLRETLPTEIVTCSVVKSELMHGAEKYENREQRLAKVQQTLAPYHSLPFDDDAAVQYARIRHQLEQQGQTIGPYDLQIASICVAYDLTLVSSNVKEFSRIRDLKLENWVDES